VTGEGVVGVVGISSSNGNGALYGLHTGTSGTGVVGDGKGNGSAGVLGRNPGAGGIGVQGQGTSGYGGQFQGGKAQLRLVPASTVGKPTTGAHVRGELYMDSAAALFVCTVTGTPGTWRKVTTTAV
jgi:hypothetical protein